MALTVTEVPSPAPDLRAANFKSSASVPVGLCTQDRAAETSLFNRSSVTDVRMQR